MDLLLQPEECVAELFFSTTDGDILGLRLGDPSVKLAEHRIGFPLVETPVETIDSIPMCGQSNAYFEFSIRLLNGEISEMDLLAFSNNPEFLNEIMESFRKQITLKKGEAHSDAGIFSWINSETGLEIYLSDESIRYGKPCIRLLFTSGSGFAV